MNSKKTSSSVASQASRALRSSSTSKIQRQLAGSALSQAKSGHQTGKKMEEILTVKKKTPKWKEWAEINLGVKPEDFSQWILETRNPALKPK